MSKDYERPELPCADLEIGQHDALRKAAEAATPGPWGVDDSEIFADDGGFMLLAETVPLRGDADPTGWSPAERANAAFIALANPATVLLLLNQIEALRARVETLTGIVRQGLAVVDSREFHALAERNAGALLMYGGPRLDVDEARAALAAAKEPS